ncbi:PH domain leucine-rich repeat-containing protein phosphatase 1 [Elysia marginata]|uniref:PH domain leucine-rich repeat-containing protein phosphatase 1 n=1 Tax=Elysia marginata TaxID=1093978 RepID=A0AAV4G985_9GAST|nr:PH domain leucine-rich repeat-containing protein phosphatase 1 [Elysia marginata]
MVIRSGQVNIVYVWKWVGGGVGEGKPLSDFTYSRNQLSTYAYIRKGKLLHQWTRRLCVISGTRLLIYREKGAEPTAVQLARGSVEEVLVKGQSLVLKLTSTLQGERSLYMSFSSTDDYNKWLRKIRKATAKLPGKADLSNCHLEFLPETVFINTELEILILRHNALRERPIEEDIYTIGWLDDLPRFNCMRSLNLADNQLTSFPLSLTNIRSLVELNLASNKLEEVPAQIAELVNLQVLHLHNNMLSSLPEELGQMRNLAVVVLAFNRFAHVPAFLLQSQLIHCKVDSVIMAGNQISRLPAEHLGNMSHIKKIDLRLNRLQLLPTETAKFHSLEHVTHMDIRENQVTDLDVRAIRHLEYLNCERNNMRSMQLNGSSLKNVFAAHNGLQTLSINPKPEWLVSLDVSKLFTDGRRLKVIKANHNRLTSLPEKICTDTLEELHLQHNMIRHLSSELFLKAARLRYLNVTKNKLCDLPPPNSNDSYNKLQELYLSFNHLANRALEKICCFPRLRVLHMARNKLSVIEEIDIEKLEQLSELNVSANNLTYLPAALGRHPKLQVLRANCNLLQELPNFKNSSGLKVLEVSSNHLVNVDMNNLMASQVSLLDISANPSILVKSHDIEAAKKRLCMLDMRGQNWSLEDLRGPDKEGEDKGLRWQTGLSQTSGIRNKLSVTTINKPVLGESGGEALFAVFDGGRNETVASLLCDVVPAALREERAKSKDPSVYLKYCLLSAHRNLKTKGQKLGASAVVAHIHRDDRGQDVLSVANVGDSQVVLCRQRRAFVMSRAFVVTKDVEDTRRVVNAGGIITEDGRVSGVTYNTRLMGCSYLFPHVIPDPNVTSTTLTPDDTAVVVANQGLWQFVSYEEAIREIKDIPDPIVAAKRLQDLAQGYGSRENIAILVVRLMLSEEERLRIHDLMRVQRKAQKELLKVLNPRDNLLLLRDGVPRVEELNEVIIDKFGHAKKGRRGSRKALHNEDGTSSGGGSVIDGLAVVSRHDSKITVHGHERREIAPALTDSKLNALVSDNVERSQDQRQRNQLPMTDVIEVAGNSQQIHYRKKNMSSPQTSSESVKRRIQEEIKTREIKNIFNEGSEKVSDVHKKNSALNGENQLLHSRLTEDEKTPVNWLAQKPRDVRKGNNPEEWQELLHQRLTQELVDREIKKMINERDSHNIHDMDNFKDSSLTNGGSTNWATQEKVSKKTAVGFSSDGIFSRPITRPEAEVSQAQSVEDRFVTLSGTDGTGTLLHANSSDSIGSEVIRMVEHSPESYSSEEVSDFSYNKREQVDGSEHSMLDQNVELDEDFEEDRFSVSPSESVSSIDLRLNNEADEIYRLRYFNPHHSKSDLQGSQENGIGSVYPPPTHFEDSGDGITDKNMFSNQETLMARPLSPDSLISQDDFVKPPISTVNIDRDALLFHQMQMARAQAHAGSVASLDSVQSAPMHTNSRRDIFPQVRTSSHSIEVLVNIGEGEEGNRNMDRSSSSQLIEATSSGLVGRGWGSNDPSKSVSSSTITGGSSTNIEFVKQLEHVQRESSHQLSRSSQDKLRYNHISKDMPSRVEDSLKPTKSDTTEKYEEDEDDEDRNTLVGDNDSDDIANLEDLEKYDENENCKSNKEREVLPLANQDKVSTRSSVHVPQPPIPPTVLGDNAYESNDSDSDESIGNVSLGDGYTAIEFPTNVDRNGSLSMLNVLESESEDYPELLTKTKFHDHSSKSVLRRSLQDLDKRKYKMRHGSHTILFGSQQHGMSAPQAPKETLRTEKDDPTISPSSVIPEKDPGDMELHGNSDYEDIDEFKEDRPGAEIQLKCPENFVDDMNLYEEMQYSPTASEPAQTAQLETPPTEKPTEEDIDALYAKVNKIKMQKIRRDSTKKNNMSDLLLLDHTNVSNSMRHLPENKTSELSPPSLPARFTPEGMEASNDEEEEIFISASDLLPKLPPRPPLPAKSANGFPKTKRLSSVENNTNRTQPNHNSSKESYTDSTRRSPSQAYPVHNSSQESTPFHTPKSSPVPATKITNKMQNHAAFENKSKSLKSHSHKPPSPQSAIREHTHLSETQPTPVIPTLSRIKKQPSAEATVGRADLQMNSRSESPTEFMPHTSKDHRNSRPPPPLPPKKPYINSNVKSAPHMQPSRPPFPLKPHLQQQQQQQQQQLNKRQIHQQHLKRPNSSHISHPPVSQPHQDTHGLSTFHGSQDRNHQRLIAPPAPKPRLSKKASYPPPVPQPPPNPMSSTNFTQSVRLTDPLPFRSQPRSERPALPPGGTYITFPHVDENADDDVDNSVLSAHELYPDAHFPGSSYLSNSSEYPVGTSHLPSQIDMSAAASRLPTQRSIIITYL